MQNAKKVLDIISDRGKRKLPLYRIYRLLYNKELFLMAYRNLYANKGAMTKGVTNETVDGMSISKIDRIIDQLKRETYRFHRSGANTSGRKAVRSNAHSDYPLGRTNFCRKSFD